MHLNANIYVGMNHERHFARLFISCAVTLFVFFAAPAVQADEKADLVQMKAACAKFNVNLGSTFCLKVSVKGAVARMTISRAIWDRAPDAAAQRSVAYRLGTLWNDIYSGPRDIERHLYMYDDRGRYIVGGINAE